MTVVGTEPAWAAGAIVEYPAPIFASSPLGTAAGAIARGPDINLWFLDSSGNDIVRLTTAGTFTAFAVPTPSAGLGALVTGPDGALWFLEARVARVARMTLAGAVTEVALPTGVTAPQDMTAGPD